MWISKEKYEALVARVEFLESRGKVLIPTGKTRKESHWGHDYEMPITHEVDIRDAILHVMQAAGVCLDYTPEQPASPAVATFKKCDKKGK